MLHAGAAHSIDRENSHDLLPLSPFVGMPTKLFGQCSSEVLDSIPHFEDRVRLPSEAAGVRRT